MRMICDECGKPAAVRLTSIVNGEKVTRNLCGECMEDVRKSMPNLDLSGLVGILASLIQATKKIDTEDPDEIMIVCEDCGTTYEQFQKRGLLGCTGCYRAFREPLLVLLQRVHGHTQHVGKRPGAYPGDMSERINLNQLRRQLQQAIADEEYEQAAVLRDRIREYAQGADCEEVHHDRP